MPSVHRTRAHRPRSFERSTTCASRTARRRSRAERCRSAQESCRTPVAFGGTTSTARCGERRQRTSPARPPSNVVRAPSSVQRITPRRTSCVFTTQRPGRQDAVSFNRMSTDMSSPSQGGRAVDRMAGRAISSPVQPCDRVSRRAIGCTQMAIARCWSVRNVRRQSPPVVDLLTTVDDIVSIHQPREVAHASVDGKVRAERGRDDGARARNRRIGDARDAEARQRVLGRAQLRVQQPRSVPVRVSTILLRVEWRFSELRLQLLRDQLRRRRVVRPHTHARCPRSEHARSRCDRDLIPLVWSRMTIVVGLRFALAVALCLGCGAAREGTVGSAPVDVDSVRIDSSAWQSAPRLSLVLSASVCGPGEDVVCPSSDLILGGAAADSSVVLVSRSGAAYLRPSGQRGFRQIAFDANQGAAAGSGGSVESAGDTAWWLHLPDAPSRALIDASGKVLLRESPSHFVGYTGSAMNADLFARMIVPGGRRPGDSVTAEFVVIGPRDRWGDVLASVTQRATFAEGARDVPLPPLFHARPIWRLSSDGLVVFCEPAEYAIDWRNDAGVLRRLVVAAPSRPVTEAELDAVSSRLRSRMPQNNARFLEAVDADLQRRRRDAARRHPAVTDIRLSSSGTMWVRGSPDAETDSVRWDVFSPDLELSGALHLDATDQVLIIEEERLLLSRLVSSGSRSVAWFELRARGSTTDQGTGANDRDR